MIYPKFQLLIVGLTSLAVGLSCAIMFASVRYGFHQIRKTGFNEGLPPEHAFFRLVELQLSRVQTGMWVGMLASLVITVALQLYFSHKLVGPLRRIEKDLRSFVKSGRPNEIQIRKEDELSEFISVINQVLKKQK